MKARQVIKIGYYMTQDLMPEDYVEHFFSKKRPWARILITLANYLVKYSKQFDGSSLMILHEGSRVLPNGTWTGVYGLVNRSKVDIGLPPAILEEATRDVFDHCYPYRLTTFTFVTPKPLYIPHIFGISQTFAVSLWIAILLAIIAVITSYYVILKKKCSFQRIFLHVFAVLLRQSTIIVHSSSAEKLLLCSWVVGAMFLCLGFESVFLSFLAVPPVAKIKDVEQLAAAVANGEYHCVDLPSTRMRNLLKMSNLESLRMLGKDMAKNLENREFMIDFVKGKVHNFALVTDVDYVEVYSRISFVSEDRFLEHMSAMPVRKGFCCKEILNTFVHRLMASGLYFKYFSDSVFLWNLPKSLKNPENADNNNRILTLIDVAPAFIFLLAGYFISFVVFVGEIVSNFWKKRNHSMTVKRSEKKKVHIEDEVEIEMH